MLPILETATHMDVLDSTSNNIVCISKELFEGAHDHSSWKKPGEIVSWCKVTLQIFGNSCNTVFLDHDNDFFQKFFPIPVSLESDHCEFLLSFVIDQGFSELLGMVVYVLWEKEHDGQPDIIRSDLDIAMFHISFTEGLHKPILIMITEMAALLVILNSPFGTPNLASLDRFLSM